MAVGRDLWKRTMPQFDPTYFTPQLFWLIVTFAALYFIMARYALPRVGDILDERQKRIDENLEQAAALKADTDAAIAAYEAALAQSRAKAHELLKEAAETMARAAEARNRELTERLNRQIKSGEARIQAAKREALANVRQIAFETAAAAASRLTGVAPDEDKLIVAVAAAVEEQGR